MAKRILLTAGRIPSALELARALARAGCYVVVADSYPTYLCQGSRAVAKTYVVPPPRLLQASYQLAILDIVFKEKIDLIIPASEEVLYLAAFKDELTKHCEVYFADSALLLTCHNKQNFNNLAHSYGLPVPSSTPLLLQSSAVKQVQAKDYVLKRSYSRGGNAVIFAAAGTDPKECSVPFDGSWLIQERIPGETLCSFSIAQHGHTRLTQVYRPSVTLGTTGVVFKNISEPKILMWVEEFIRKSKFHGFISFDFLRDQKGDIFAVECNPRITSGIHLLPPELITHALLEAQGALPALRSRSRAQIAFGVLSALPDLILNPRLAWQAFKECVLARDVMFQWNDLGPVLYQFPCYFYFIHRSRKQHISLTGCTMDGIEWNN
ncbi:MAG: ATP-grasp domain-containing protein [Proteobacteria bacterium]|nr:ATP-grasp domain-containing protein [Pseudomonadota bacterium]